MEHKTWLWRRKTSGKTAHGNDEYGLSLKGNQEAFKAEELERSLKSLDEKLTSALTDSTAKDDLLAKHIKVAEEALEGWEKAEAEAASLKEELDDVLQSKFTAEEKIAELQTALEECKQQLQVGHEEQKQMASNAAMKALREKEKIRKLEERLVELNKRLSKLGSDNSNLIKTLETKEKVIEDLSECNNQSYTKINAMTENLESLEKNNASLKYEVCMLDKELQIRNEEKEFNLKSVDAAHKQHLESVKKIAKLESECQRLRVMVRKRLPGPAALAKMRKEVEMLEKDTYEMKKQKPNSTRGLLARDFVVEKYSDSSNSMVSLVERLNATEDENKILKETLTKKNSELQSARIMCAHAASKLSHAETKLEEIPKGHANFEVTKNSSVSYDMPVVLACENGANEDNISCAESWASALISELENFRNIKTFTISPKSSVVSELNLMDDFVDMEKLAVVCVDKPLVSSFSGIKSTCLSPCETGSKHDDSPEAINNSNVEIQSGSRSFEKSSRWLQDVVSAILQRYHVSKGSLDSILEEIRVTLANKGYSIGIHPCGDLHANRVHLQKTQHSSLNLLDAEYGANLLLGETATGQSKSTFDKSIKKLIKLIEEINEKLLTHGSILQAASKNGASTIPGRRLTYAGYISCIFHWKTTELSSNLQCLIQTCNYVLSQKIKPAIFFEHLISTIERIVNHCFSLQDVSSMKDTFRKLDWYESHGLAVGGNCQCQGRMFALPEGKDTTETSLSPSVPDNSGEELGSNLHSESRGLSNDAMKLDHLKEMKVGKNSAISENKSLIEQLVKSEKNILNYKAESETLRESKRIIEAQIEHQRLLNEELDTQLSATKVELNEVHQSFSSLEVALGDKTNCCEELEATCVELQLQLESAAVKESSKCTVNHDQKQLRTNWEISAASEKLAECQETILSLGRQLKSLASPSDAALFDKVMSKPKEAKANHHRALLDQMLAEDDEELESRSPNWKETTFVPQNPVAYPPNNPNAGLLYGRKILPNHAVDSFLQGGLQASLPIESSRRSYSSGEANKSKKEANVGALAIVPKRRKTDVSLLRKLLSRRKKDGKKLTPHAVS